MGGWELLQRGDVLIKSLCFKDVNNLTVLQFARCPSKLCLFVDLFFFLAVFSSYLTHIFSQFFFSPEILLLNSKDVWIFQIQVEYLGSILKRVSFSTDLSLQRGLR